MTKGPRFGVLIAQGEYLELDRLFRKWFLSSIAVSCLGAVTIALGVFLLHRFQHPLSARILSPLPPSCYCRRRYELRHPGDFDLSASTQAEPLAPVYLLSSLVVLALALMLGERFGALVITAGYLGAVAFIQLPLSFIVFRRRRSEWHKFPSASSLGIAAPAN